MTVNNWQYPKLVAHRGAGKLAPENTLSSVRLGHLLGFTMVEVDIKLSADGVNFLLHDSSLNRTTNAIGRADQLIWRELSKLDAGSWHSNAYAGETIPTLAALASYCIANDMLVNIEIKATEGRERETGAAVALDVLSLWQGAKIMPLISSFSAASLAACRQIAPDIAIGCLFEDDIPGDWLTQCQQVNACAINLDHQLLTAINIAQFKQAGLRVAAWTVNDINRAKQLLSWGVDCLITDNLTELIQLT